MSETEDHEKQHLDTLKRLKRGDENELERKLRLEKVVTNKHLGLAVETEEERSVRLENDADTEQLSLAMYMDQERKARLVATKRLKLAMEMDEERKAREDGSYHTAQIGLGDRKTGRQKSKKWIGFDLDLIWIEIGVLKIQ